VMMMMSAARMHQSMLLRTTYNGRVMQLE
jgi:hypothetical protein